MTAKEIHRAIADAWNRRDFEAFGALLHPEYSYTGGDGNERTGGPAVGVGIAKMYAEAFGDARLEVVRVYVDGDVAVAELRAVGTHTGDLMGIPATHRPLDLPVCNVMELRDGKVYREREYMDVMTMMTQLGLAPAAAHA